MSSDDAADDIRQRMAELRRSLAYDVEDVSRGATAMTDPSYYVRRFPWAAVAIAAAAGYMLIPKKKELNQPDPETVAELVRKQKIRVEPMKRDKEREGLLKTLLVMGITWAAKTGAGFVGQQLSSAALDRARPKEAQAPPSATQQPWQS